MSMIKERTDPEKVWFIESILIYDSDANEIVRREYSQDTVEISTELISNFVMTLESFSQNQFNEQVYEIHLGEYRVLFKEIGTFILVAIVKPGAAVDTGKASPMSKAVKRLLERTGEVLQLVNPDKIVFSNIDVSFIDEMVDTINSTADNPDSVFHNIQNLERTDRFFISSIIITDNIGRPFVSRTYDNGVYQEDELLVSSLITAITQFAGQITNREFKEIVMGKYRLFMKSVNDRIYVITAELESEDVVLNHKSKVSRYIDKLQESLIDATCFLDDSPRISDSISINHHTLTAVVDALVIKGIQGTIGEKNINRKALKDVTLFDQKQSRSSGQEQRVLDHDSYNEAKGIFSRIRGFFSRS